MSSGIKLTPDAVVAFNECQDKHLHRYVVMKFNDNYTKVVLDKVGAKDATFDDFKADLPKDHIRYVFYDCEYKTTSGQDRSKVLFVSWSSDDDAPAKEKMLVTSTLAEVKAKCKNWAKHTTINEWDEIEEENFINIVSENRSK